MAAATNSLLIMDDKQNCPSFMLYTEVCDWLEMEKTVDLTELTDEETWEMFCILYVFWNERTEGCNMHQWALDVTRWPVWLPDELKTADESEENDIIDEE